MNHTRWTNVAAARNEYEAGGELAGGGGPLEAFFEVAARCNLRCQMCAINVDTRYQPRSGRPPFFEPELFARLRPIFPTLLRAYLFGLGEPTLNKHLVDYIAELSAAGVEVWFNTNGTLIDEAKAEAIARAGASKITVSIDGATAETYETIRRGAKFDAVLRGIRALVAAKIEVNLSFVAMSSNIHELPALVDLCAELGASGVHVEPLFAQPASSELMEHYGRENLGAATTDVAALFDEAFHRADGAGVEVVTRFAGERSEFDYVRRVAKQRAD
jgi:MoaA/NifB/PqqE/SkfB family radical SAM enzyme